MRTRLGLVAVLGVAAVLTTGCAANSAPAGPVVGGASRDFIQVRVENGMPVTLRVLALVDGGETSLGRVDALSAETVKLPAGLGGTVRLVARPAVSAFSDRRHVSEPFTIMPGQRITWELRASPGISDVPRMSMVKVLACQGSC